MKATASPRPGASNVWSKWVMGTARMQELTEGTPLAAHGALRSKSARHWADVGGTHGNTWPAS